MTALNKQALREAAEEATPGRWEYYPLNTSIEYNVDSMDEDQGSILYVDSGDFTQKQTDLNGAFIAAANPATILALLDELEAAEKLIAELSHHLQCAHAFIEHTEAFGREASNGILCCGDAQWNIDESKSALTAAGKGE